MDTYDYRKAPLFTSVLLDENKELKMKSFRFVWHKKSRRIADKREVGKAEEPGSKHCRMDAAAVPVDPANEYYIGPSWSDEHGVRLSFKGIKKKCVNDTKT